MNIVRKTGTNGAWTFGNGTSNYLSGIAQVAQNIDTRLNTFLGECFFATNVGLDWFTFFGTPGASNQLAMNLAVTTTIRNTQDVVGLTQLSITVDAVSRTATIVYQVQTVYGLLNSTSSVNT
jgi:hypothetical protein